jgi:1-acyl-sn-glycerol-3-phosphate acyltransferase
MSSAVKGFPEKFPVRDDDRRPLRYRTAALIGRVYIRVLSRRRLRILGEANIPSDGPLLLVSNHISNLDPLVFGGYFPRTLFAMAKRELYVNRVASWFLAGCNCIPVDRGAADRRAVTRALGVLRGRGRLLVFVEGTRSHDGAMQHAEPGIGFLARRSGAQVLPASITGTDGNGPAASRSGGRRDVLLRYGMPFTLDLSGRRDDGAIADEIAAHIAALLPLERRGVYASRTPLARPASSPRAADGASGTPA